MEQLLTLNEVAKILRVTTLTLKRWDKKHAFVKPVRINSRGDRRYKRNEVFNFINQ